MSPCTCDTISKFTVRFRAHKPAHVKVAVEAGEPVVAGEVARGALAAAVGVGAGAAVRGHADEVGPQANRPRLEVAVTDRAAVLVVCNKATNTNNM